MAQDNVKATEGISVEKSSTPTEPTEPMDEITQHLLAVAHLARADSLTETLTSAQQRVKDAQAYLKAVEKEHPVAHKALKEHTKVNPALQRMVQARETGAGK